MKNFLQKLLYLLPLAIIFQSMQGIPQFFLFKSSAQLIQPLNPQEGYLRFLLDNLFLDKNNLRGIFGDTKQELEKLYGKNNLSQLLIKFYDEDRDILAIQENGTLLGALLFTAEKTGYKCLDIILLATHPNMHQQGIGKKLLEKLASLFPTYKAELSVLKNNTNAIAFYKKMGFTKAYSTKDSWELEKIFLNKS